MTNTFSIQSKTLLVYHILLPKSQRDLWSDMIVHTVIGESVLKQYQLLMSNSGQVNVVRVGRGKVRVGVT